MYGLDNILISLIFILLQFFLFLLNYKLHEKKIIHPAVLFSFLWLSIISVHLLFSFSILDQLAPLGIQTYLVIFIGTCAFSIGSFLVVATQQHQQPVSPSFKNIAPEEHPISMTLRLIMVAIIVIGLPFYIRATYKLFIASQIDDFFAGVRTAITYYEEDIGPVKYLISFSFMVFGINLFCFFKEKTQINRLLVWLCFFVSIAYAVLSTGRTYFFFILAVYVGISYLKSKNFSLKNYALLAVFFLLFFMAIGIFWGKGGDKDSSTKENIPVATEITATYLVLSLNALDYQISHPVEINSRGDNTLRFFIKIGQSLNLLEKQKVNSLLKEFLFIPYGTNVYTIYSDYLKDFGRFYAWFMLAIFGGLHTWVHTKAIKYRSLRYILYFSFLLYPLLMSFFQDQYMSLFSTWVQLVFYVELFLFANKFFILQKW